MRCTSSRATPSSASSSVIAVSIPTAYPASSSANEAPSGSIASRSFGCSTAFLPLNASAESITSSRLTFSSSSTCPSRRLSPSACVALCTNAVATARGWRTLIAALLRAARPRLTTRITSLVSWISCSSTSSSSASVHAARWTLSGALPSTERTRFWYIASAKNGVNGASSFVSVTRHVYSVRYAASLSASAPDPSAALRTGFQKRRLLLRTYQFERSSTNCWTDRPLLVGSYRSRSSVTLRTSELSSDSTQQSSSESSPSPAVLGSNPSRLAYVTKKQYVFQSVSKKRRNVSDTNLSEKRRASPGRVAVYRYQRRASAPCSSITAIGSTTLPRLLLIFRPLSSKMSPRQITLRYEMSSGASSVRLSSTASACSV